MPLLLAGLLAMGGCDCGRGPVQPNILLVVVDTFRADHLGCYDYARPTSPAIDAISREGITFDAAYTSAPWTLPAFASIVTSRYPWEHGATSDYFPIAPDLPTIAQELKKGGYETAAFVSHIYTSSNYGFEAGFDRFVDFDITRDYRFDESREPVAGVVAGGAMELLRSGALEEPFFLLVHFFDPHWDYGAPEEWRDCFVRQKVEGIDGTYRTLERYLHTDSLLAEDELDYLVDLYDGEIRYVDSWIDSLVTEFDRITPPHRSVVVLTADHGEEFQDHSSVGHAFTFFEEVLRVPLILRDRSRIPETKRSGRAVTLIDIFPTLLDAAGLSAPAGIRGQSLYRIEAMGDRTLLAGTTREGRFGRAAIRNRSKLIWDRDGYHLFRLHEDPLEMDDRALPRSAETALLSKNIASEVSPGGWTIRWTADSAGVITLKGSVRVNGFLVDVIPDSEGEFRLTSSNDHGVQFTATGGGGVNILTEPPSAPVQFSFEVNGVEDARLIMIGREMFHPPAASFGLDPGTVEPSVLQAPGDLPPSSLPFVSIWKEGEARERATILLDSEEKDRLRALGYF